MNYVSKSFVTRYAIYLYTVLWLMHTEGLVLTVASSEPTIHHPLGMN